MKDRFIYGHQLDVTTVNGVQAEKLGSTSLISQDLEFDNRREVLVASLVKVLTPVRLAKFDDAHQAFQPRIHLCYSPNALIWTDIANDFTNWQAGCG